MRAVIQLVEGSYAVEWREVSGGQAQAKQLGVRSH